MPTTTQEALRRWEAMLTDGLRRHPDIPLDFVCLLSLTANGETTLHRFHLGAGGVRHEIGHDGRADLTIALTAQDFVAVVSGQLNPVEAFMSGRLTLSGDFGLAMNLARLLQNDSD